MTRSALSRLADRRMAALPTGPAGTIALTAIGLAALVAPAIHWPGSWWSVALLLAGAMPSARGARPGRNRVRSGATRHHCLRREPGREHAVLAGRRELYAKARA